jgi:uncharacterized phage-like protein YoqJ
MNQNTCFFTGHRILPADKIEHIIKRLSDEIDNLMDLGVTDFISGGALGYDQIAAAMVAAKREMGHNIRLIFVLPCRNQDEYWTAEQKQLYRGLLNEADEIRYVSEEYSADCMKNRNYHMVDNSRYCICAMFNDRSGTAQTVRYAQKKSVIIINVAE